MKTFRIELSSENAAESIDGIVSFVGSDESGSFGILADREPLVTALAWGLCRFSTDEGKTHFLAFPGGVLTFADGVLHIATPRYLRDDDSVALLARLEEGMRTEAEDRRAMRQVLRNLDRELLRRLAQSP